MILRELKLQNIRSYTNETIVFPEGSLLLSGDIGSGKSTILQAIEFALFGILRGASSGASILRNGANEGSVELTTLIQGKPITIRRTLKRTKSSVTQGSGYIIENDLKKEGTPVELKAWMLDLLGYPKEILSKSKSLIFRYTVYTPQEDMKAILFEEKEQRLDTLRKVFDIDKYRRIRENALTYTKELKTRMREQKVALQEKDFKQKRMQELMLQQKDMQSRLEQSKQVAEEAKTKTTEKKLILETLEVKRKEFTTISQELAICESKLKEKTTRTIQIQAEIQTLQKQLAETKIEQDTPDVKEKLDENKQKLKAYEAKLVTSTKNLTILSQKMDHANHLKEKITSLNECPVCLQNVDDTHKQQITQKENDALKELTKKYTEMKEIDAKVRNAIQTLQNNIELLQKQQSKAAVIKLQKKQYEERLQRQKLLQENLQAIQKEQQTLTLQKEQLLPKRDLLKESEAEYQKQKEEHNKASQIEREAQIKHITIAKDNEAATKRLEELQEDLTKIEKAEKKIQELSSLLQWIEESFINLMIVMEKHVMMNVYHEFNELFMKWFDMLIEDETIQVRLDDEFTPIVIQNGYETDMEGMSGGEKTSLALAYRLSLNKVINDMMDTIKTKDILILDEPTEGFSIDQLDRVRDVLRDLQTTQVIVVSHESKIESYVDHVIRVSKNEHISKVLS